MITQNQLADRRMMIQAAAERLRSTAAQKARIKSAVKRTSSVARKVKPKKDQVTGFEYAQEYYGQRYEDTVRWDDVGDHNDWS